jgi:hypothetical protein
MWGAIMGVSHQWGDNRPVAVPVALAKAVARGDICGTATADGTLVKASEEAYVTSGTVTRQNFVAKFAGISSQMKEANKPVYGNQGSGLIRLGTGGAWVIPYKTGITPKVQDMVGPTFVAGTNVLLDQEVDIVAAKNEAIGVIVGLRTDVGCVEVEMWSVRFPSAA